MSGSPALPTQRSRFKSNSTVSTPTSSLAPPLTTSVGDHHVIEFDTSNANGIYAIPLLVQTPGVSITANDV